MNIKYLSTQICLKTNTTWVYFVEAITDHFNRLVRMRRFSEGVNSWSYEPGESVASYRHRFRTELLPAHPVMTSSRWQMKASMRAPDSYSFGMVWFHFLVLGKRLMKLKWNQVFICSDQLKEIANYNASIYSKSSMKMHCCSVKFTPFNTWSMP